MGGLITPPLKYAKKLIVGSQLMNTILFTNKMTASRNGI